MKIQRKTDETFIVDLNGNPFHITPEYPQAEQYGIEMTHAAIKAYAEAHPEDVSEYVEPAPVTTEISEEEKTASEMRELEREALNLLPIIQAGIDTDTNQQKLTDVMLEIEKLKGNI